MNRIDDLASEAERLATELQQRENDQINAEMNLEHQSAEIDPCAVNTKGGRP